MSRQKNNSHKPRAFREQFLIGISARHKIPNRNLSSLAAWLPAFAWHTVATIARSFYQKYNQKSIFGVVYG